MNQNIWGPHLWFSLHSISFNYPLKPTENDRNYYRNFFNNLKEVIPCSVCKKNYIRHLTEHPINNYLNNRKSIVYWVIDMHNMVNVEIGKKIYSYDKVIKKYEDVYKKKIILEDNDENINQIINYNYNSNNDKNYSISYDNNIIIYLFFVLLLLLLIINLISIRKK